MSERSRDERKPAVNKAVDSDAAVDILAELRRQQQEQKQLIHEQRAIVDELRRHENVAHHLHDDDKYQVCVLVCVPGTCVCVCTGARVYGCMGVCVYTCLKEAGFTGRSWPSYHAIIRKLLLHHPVLSFIPKDSVLGDVAHPVVTAAINVS